MDEKARRFYAKVEKYGGWKRVPADRIHDLANEIIEPAKIGFVKAHRGFLVRKISEDISHAIKLDALKGASYGISCGVWLPFVPFPYAPQLRWHRSLKSAELTLRNQPQEWLQERQCPQRPDHGFTADSMLGEQCFREEFGKAWRSASVRVQKWFAETVTLESVLSRCDEQSNRQNSGICFVPEPGLVRALTLARMGRIAKANEELESFLEQSNTESDARANLRRALGQIVPG